MSSLRQAFITLFMAVRCSQVLSEETSGYIKANCHYARLLWSALISSKKDIVWERSGGIRPACGDINVLYCTLWWIYQTQLHLKYVLLSQGVYTVLLGFSLMNHKCNHSPHTSKLMMRHYFFSINSASQWLNYFYCYVSMMYTFPKLSLLRGPEDIHGANLCLLRLNVRDWNKMSCPHCKVAVGLLKAFIELKDRSSGLYLQRCKSAILTLGVKAFTNPLFRRYQFCGCEGCGYRKLHIVGRPLQFWHFPVTKGCLQYQFRQMTSCSPDPITCRKRP